MAKMRTISLLAVLGLAWGTANADTLDMRGASAPGSVGPARGTTQAVVEAKFGAPASVKAPVGDPPITRWEYANFVVFFEYDKVIHSVRKK